MPEKEAIAESKSPAEEVKEMEHVLNELMQGDEARKILTQCFDKTKDTLTNVFGIDPKLLPEKLDFSNPNEKFAPDFQSELNKCSGPPIIRLLQKQMNERKN